MEDDSDVSIKAYVKKTASLSFVVKASGMALAFILQLILTRIFTPEIYGTYYLLTSTSLFVVAFAVFGLDKASLKIIPEYDIDNDVNGIRSFKRYSIVFIVVTSAVVGLLSAFAIDYIYGDKFSAINTIGLVLIVAICIGTSLAIFYSGLFQGFKQPIKGQLPQQTLKPLFILCSLGIALILTVQFDLNLALGVNLIAVMLVLMVYMLMPLPTIAQEGSPLKWKERWKSWLKLGLGFQGIVICNIFLTQTDVVMIGAMLDERSVAFYGVASKVANLLTFFLVSVNSVVTPLISKYNKQQQYEKLAKLMKFVSKIVTLFTVASAVALIFLSEYILALFGNEYIASKSMLIILCIGCCINAITGAVSYLLSLTGNQKKVIQILSFCAILNFLLNFLLIKYMGLIGAAIATATVMVLWNFLMLIAVVRKLGVNPTCFNLGAKYET